MINEVMEYLPKSIKDEIYKFIREQNNVQESIEEIRLRTNKNITIKIEQELIELKHQITKQELTETFENICENMYICNIYFEYMYIKNIDSKLVGPF